MSVRTLIIAVAFTAEISAPLRKLFRELGFNGFSNVIAFTMDHAESTVAVVEWTAIADYASR
jgi:hypothetical protein